MSETMCTHQFPCELGFHSGTCEELSIEPPKLNLEYKVSINEKGESVKAIWNLTQATLTLDDCDYYFKINLVPSTHPNPKIDFDEYESTYYEDVLGLFSGWLCFNINNNKGFGFAKCKPTKTLLKYLAVAMNLMKDDDVDVNMESERGRILSYSQIDDEIPTVQTEGVEYYDDEDLVIPLIELYESRMVVYIDNIYIPFDIYYKIHVDKLIETYNDYQKTHSKDETEKYWDEMILKFVPYPLPNELGYTSGKMKCLEFASNSICIKYDNSISKDGTYTNVELNLAKNTLMMKNKIKKEKYTLTTILESFECDCINDTVSKIDLKDIPIIEEKLYMSYCAGIFSGTMCQFKHSKGKNLEIIFEDCTLLKSIDIIDPINTIERIALIMKDNNTFECIIYDDKYNHNSHYHFNIVHKIYSPPNVNFLA